MSHKYWKNLKEFGNRGPFFESPGHKSNIHIELQRIKCTGLFKKPVYFVYWVQNYWNPDITCKQQKVSGVIFFREFRETGARSEDRGASGSAPAPPLKKTNKPWLLSVVKVDSNDAETLVTEKGQKQTKLKQQLNKWLACNSASAMSSEDCRRVLRFLWEQLISKQREKIQVELINKFNLYLQVFFF